MIKMIINALKLTLIFFHSCDFNKYTIRVIKKMSQAKLQENIELDGDDEMLLIRNVNGDASGSDVAMTDDETSEE